MTTTFMRDTKTMIIACAVGFLLCVVAGAKLFAATIVGVMIGLYAARSVYADLHEPDPRPWWETGWFPDRHGKK